MFTQMSPSSKVSLPASVFFILSLSLPPMFFGLDVLRLLRAIWNFFIGRTAGPTGAWMATQRAGAPGLVLA